MIRYTALLGLTTMLPGCAIFAPVGACFAASPCVAALSASAGAIAGVARVDQTVLCWAIAKEGIKEEQSVSAVCQTPAPAAP